MRTHQDRSGEFVDPELSERVLSKPLDVAGKILATISNPGIERPIGMLIWKLRQVEAAPPAASAQPRAPASSPRSAGSRPPSEVAMAVNATSAQPSRDALRPTLPLVVVDRGEAGNLAAETLYCMSCSLPAVYRRRANRASGTDQPLSLHRFSHCGCGADTSILMHELFPSVYQITFMMFRPATTTSDRTLTLATLTASGDRRDLVAAASDQPQPSVRRFPVEDVRCAGCSDRLSLVLYDPIDHFFHSVEYGCPRCQEIYSGAVTFGSNRLFGSFIRQRTAA